MTTAVDDFLAHHGVKGMKWGVRKKEDTSGRLRFQAAGPAVDAKLPKETQAAGENVARLMGQRYGFQITAVKGFGPGHPEYEYGTLAYVEHTPGTPGNVIYARQADVRKQLKEAEKVGWSGENCGTMDALFTHESAHAMFHAEETVERGFFRNKAVGGNIEARDKALNAAVKAANKSGIANNQFIKSVSGYAATSGTREEMEAELFSQYHWSPNPPQFVKVWGQTLHQEMGVDGTPFREGR